MKIGFDLDGVLYPWHRYFYKYMFNSNNLGISYHAFWANIDNIESIFDREYLEGVIKLPILYLLSRVDRKILDKLSLLSKDNELYYITSRPESVEKMTKSWLFFSKVPQRENFFLRKDKIDTIKLLKLDAYVEDRLDNYYKINEFTNCLLIRHPWNNYGKNIPLAFYNTASAIDYLLFEKLNELSR